MKIAVIGAGAMGSLFGGRLALSGQDVRLIDIDKAHVDAINRDGLTLDTDDGRHLVRVPAGPASAFSDPVDLLIVFTKGYATAAALTDARHLANDSTWALTLQNGLGAGERVAEALPGVRVAIGVTDIPADLQGPGHVGSHGRGEIRLWTLSGGADPAIDGIVDTLSTAGLNARADRGASVAVWEKAIFNTVMNPVAALTRRTVGEMASHPDGRLLSEAILKEAFAVARACAVPIDEARVRAAVDHAYRSHGSHKPSMLQDVLAGRRTEVDSIVGALAARAQASGVAAPILETLTRLTRMITSDAK